MKNEDLIEKLSSDLKPIEPVESLKTKTLKTFFFALLCAIAGISLSGLREDWVLVFRNPYALIKNILLFVGVISTSVSALLLSIPGQVKGKFFKLFSLLPFGIWAFLLILENIIKPEFHSVRGMSCASEVIVLGVIQSIFMFVILRRAIALDRAWVGFLVLISAAGLGVWLLQFTCHNDDPAHLLVWHFLPALILGILGVFIGKKILLKL